MGPRLTKRAVILLSFMIAALGSGGCGTPCDGDFYCYSPCEQAAFQAGSYDEALAGCRANVNNGLCGADADPKKCACDCED
jgi:hypothetical protein